MTITAKLADGRILKFPDGTDPAVMQATVKNMMGVNVEAPLRPEQAATPMNEDFIPTGENLAAEQARTDAIQNQTTEADVFGFESAESNAAVAPFFETQTATNVPFSNELAGATEVVSYCVSPVPSYPNVNSGFNKSTIPPTPYAKLIPPFSIPSYTYVVSIKLMWEFALYTFNAP